MDHGIIVEQQENNHTTVVEHSIRRSEKFQAFDLRLCLLKKCIFQFGSLLVLF